MGYLLHIANKNYSSWSLRPWALMRELGIPFDEMLTPFTDAEDNHARFAAFSPNAKVPCLVDGETTVWESLSIIEYLAERHPGVWPDSPQARAWARSAAAEMHAGFTALRSRCPMNCALVLRLAAIDAPLAADLARIDALWRDGLKRFSGPFLAGSRFTAVDAFFAPVALRWAGFGLPLSAQSAAYAERLLASAALREWRAAALDEPAEAGHEAQALAGAELVEDLRAPAHRVR
ncbi:glutathione S-transferase family protein [Halotalea alkalilenta]|uniref:Glutathione S-transferase n=1 Tax=Halotalea alkalilenta TaxID=376489 RepID=A0A172YBJ2_9GAMM|nr:glutathione S-transferase family protein [Halotalea alkalilenta]ANF56613.1 glutathione S-transferase [Halotalea alkalilenta]